MRGENKAFSSSLLSLYFVFIRESRIGNPRQISLLAMSSFSFFYFPFFFFSLLLSYTLSEWPSDSDLRALLVYFPAFLLTPISVFSRVFRVALTVSD